MLEKLVWKAKVWKCLKVVVFVCRVIPSVQVCLINECETELYWIIGQDYWWNYFRPALPILYRNAVLCLALSLCQNRFLSAGRQEDYSVWPTNILIAYRALIIHKNTVGGDIWCSFLSTHAFLLGNGQTCNTRCSILSRFLHFHVSQFPPLQVGAVNSCLAFSTPSTWCRIFSVPCKSARAWYLFVALLACHDVIYDTIRDAILTCARKPT